MQFIMIHKFTTKQFVTGFVTLFIIKIFTHWPTLRSDPFVFRYVDTLYKSTNLNFHWLTIDTLNSNQKISFSLCIDEKKTVCLEHHVIYIYIYYILIYVHCIYHTLKCATAETIQYIYVFNVLFNQM